MVCCKCCQGYASLCRVFTYGWLIAGTVLSCFAVASCEFLTRGDTRIGMFKGDDAEGTCIAYRDIEGFSYGWLHDWARICAFLAPIFGFSTICLMLVDCCCKVCCSRIMQTFFVVCCWMSQSMTFLLYASDRCLFQKGAVENSAIIYRGCNIADGSIYSFSAFWVFFIGGFFLCCSPTPDPYCGAKDDDNKKGCCGKKDEDEKEAEEGDAKTAAAAEEKPKEEDPEVVPVPVPVEKKEEEEASEEEPKEPEEAPEEQEAKAVPADEEPADEEAPEEQEAPAVVPVPVPVPVPAPRAKTPQPEDESMEMELDEEFGLSMNRAPIME